MNKKQKILVFSAITLVIVVLSSLAVASDAFLGIYYSIVGKPVQCLIVSYAVEPLGNSVTLNFVLSSGKSKVPVQTVMYGFSTQDNSAASTSNFGITMEIWATVTNGNTVYWVHMHFSDSKSRTITCYLDHYDAAEYPVFTGHVQGNYVYEGAQTSFSYDKELSIDTLHP